MSKDPEELELEALQRRLDDAFATTRPRRGFEDELWVRMQRRRPLAGRLGDLFGGLVGGIREAPGVSAGVAALVVIVALGVGVIGPYLSRVSHNTASSAAAPQLGGGADRSAQWTGPTVPTPVLHPGLFESHPPVPSGVQRPSMTLSGNLYFGPANLTWAGTFPSSSVSAPVVIYAEPKSVSLQTDNGQFGSLQGVTVTTRGSVSQLPLAPVYFLTELDAGVEAGADPVEAALNFLQAHNLAPTWPYSSEVIDEGSATRVILQREFVTQNGDLAHLVDWNGERYGIEVDIVNGKRTAEGPLSLPLETVQLPLISNADAAQLAVSQPPASTQAFSPIPTVTLDKVELVYALAIAGGNGFYEPAYLFSGTFQYNGDKFTKRVLVPLVAPSLRS